jgi:hypothetical protein
MTDYQFQINFLPTNLKNIDLNTVKYKDNEKGNENNKDNKETDYYYLSADFFNHNHPVNVFLDNNKMYYTTEKLFIIGDLNGSENPSEATLVIYLKSASDYGENKPSQVYMCYPLKSSKINSKQNVDEILSILNKETNSLDLNSILYNYNDNYELSIESNNTTDTFVYIFKNTFSVFNLATYLTDLTEEDDNKNTKSKSSKKKKPDIRTPKVDVQWLTYISQETAQGNKKRTPFDLSILNNDSIENPPISTKGIINEGLTNEEQIYIQCSPVGASEETTPMKLTNPKESPGNSENTLKMYSMLFVTIMVVISSVWAFSNIINRLLSFDFKRIIGIDGSNDPPNPLIMYLFFVMDMFPVVSGLLLNTFGFSNLTRKYLKSGQFIPDTKEKKIQYFKRIFFALLYVFVVMKLSSHGKTTDWMFLFGILILIFSQMLFFIIMSRTTMTNLAKMSY